MNPNHPDFTHTGESPTDEAEFERKVLRSFLTPDGKIKTLPAQAKKLQVILRRIVNDFEFGQDYPEKTVNAMLACYHEDTAFLRRSLVDTGLLARQAGMYWRPEFGHSP